MEGHEKLTHVNNEDLYFFTKYSFSKSLPSKSKPLNIDNFICGVNKGQDLIICYPTIVGSLLWQCLVNVCTKLFPWPSEA